MKALSDELKIALVALLGLLMLVGCPRPSLLQVPTTPAKTQARQVPDLEGQVHFDERTTQADMTEVATRATVSIIDVATNLTLASTVTNNTGGFRITLGAAADGLNPSSAYFIEAIKGLSAGATGNRAGAPLARVRTLVYWNGEYWTSLTNSESIILSRSTTALAILASLHLASGRPVSVAALNKSVLPQSPDTSIQPATPDTFNPGASQITNEEFHQVYGLVSEALVADQDPVASIALDAGPPLRYLRSERSFSAASVNPAVGTVNDVVTLSGSGFDPVPANNVVRFNGWQGEVQSVSGDRTTLTVKVPHRSGLSGTISVQIGNLIKLGPLWSQNGWSDAFADANNVKGQVNVNTGSGAITLTSSGGSADTSASDFARGLLNGLAATASDPVDGGDGAVTMGIKPLRVLQVYPDGHNQTVAAQGVYNWRADLFEFDLLKTSSFNTLTTVDDHFFVNPILKDYAFTPPRATASITQLDRTLRDYDILYFGIADSYAGMDLTTNSRDVTRAFAQLGRGVVFTHDTVGSNFRTLTDLHGHGYTGYSPYVWASIVYQAPGVDKTSSVLTKPFDLSSVNSFPIQGSHSLSQSTAGGSSVWYGYDPATASRTVYWTTYTTTTSNAAFFSYGHTEAVPSEYEAKAMINSMYYTYDRGNTISGTYTSGTFDSGSTGYDWSGTPLTWVANKPAGTNITFQVAATDDPAATNLTYVGPSGTTATSIGTSGSLLPAVTGRYLRYRATLTTTSLLSVPVLSRVGVNNAAAATSVAISPSSLSAWTSVAFTANTPSGSSVRLQLLDKAGNVVPESALPGNSSGFTTSPINLSSLSTATYPVLRLRVSLIPGTGAAPQLTSWRINWAP